MRRETKHSDRRVARKVMRASTKPFCHENCMTQEILMKKAPELISLFKSKNQIKSTCFTLITQGVVSQSPEPEAHVLCVRAFLRVKLKFRSAGFWREGKTRVPRGKPLGTRKEPTTNLAHIRSELTWVGGECSHHCASPAPQTEDYPII